ncbi:aldo/keto reductase [Jatrophihabitans sp. YIM 134969]
MTDHFGPSCFGVGLAALARPAYITTGRDDALGADRSVQALRDRTGEVLDAAYAAGVRYVDAARSYGRAEEFLADWLARRPDVHDAVVASKWGYRYVGDWRRDAEVHEVKDHSAAAFTEQLAATRELLGDRLALHQVHSLMPDDPLFDDRDALAGLARLRDDGVRIGFSTSGPDQAVTVRRAMTIRAGGTPLFAAVQATWNVLETSVGAALADAAAAGLDVIVKEGLANGRLAPGSDDPAPAAVAVREVAARHGASVDAVALAAVLAQPWRPRVLSGAVTVDQLRSNLAAATVVLSADDQAVLTATPEPADRYWRQRSQRAWS